MLILQSNQNLKKAKSIILTNSIKANLQWLKFNLRITPASSFFYLFNLEILQQKRNEFASSKQNSQVPFHLPNTTV